MGACVAQSRPAASVALGCAECCLGGVVSGVKELDRQLVQRDVLGRSELGQGDEVRLAGAIDVELPGHEQQRLIERGLAGTVTGGDVGVGKEFSREVLDVVIVGSCAQPVELVEEEVGELVKVQGAPGEPVRVKAEKAFSGGPSNPGGTCWVMRLAAVLASTTFH
jgi:hypothetical protein